MYNYTCIVCTIVYAFCTHTEIGNSQPCLLPPLRNFASLTWPPLSFSVVIMTSIQTQENTHTHQQWLNIHKDIKVRAQKHIQPVSWLPVRYMNLFKDTLRQEKPDRKTRWNWSETMNHCTGGDKLPLSASRHKWAFSSYHTSLRVLPWI